MTNTILHSALPDNELHEVKGALTAQEGEVLIALGDTTSSFSTLKNVMNYLEPMEVSKGSFTHQQELTELINTLGTPSDTLRDIPDIDINNNFASLCDKINKMTEQIKILQENVTSIKEVQDILVSILYNFNLGKEG